MIIEKIYNSRNNTIDLLLKSDGVAVDLAAVTRMQVVVGSTIIDSQAHPTWFNWAPAPPTPGKVILALGAAGLPVGDGSEARLYVFDPSNPLGIAWGTFYLDVA